MGEWVYRSTFSWPRHWLGLSGIKCHITNSVALSPQANFTDWSIATGRRNLVPTFADRGVSRGQCGGSPTVVNLSFLDRSRYFFFQVVPHLPARGWVDPVSDPLLLRKCVSAWDRSRDLWVSSQELWPLDHRGGQKIKIYKITVVPVILYGHETFTH
jgi:hypothetical protein